MKNLTEYILNTPSQELAEKLDAPNTASQSSFSVNLHPRSKTHMDNFGHIVFQLDFAEDRCRSITPK